MGFDIRAIITAPNYERDSAAGKAVTEYLTQAGIRSPNPVTLPGDDTVWFADQKWLDVDALIDAIRAAAWSSGEHNVQLFVRRDDEERFSEVPLWVLEEGES